MMLFRIFIALPCATESSHSLSLSYHFIIRIRLWIFKQSTCALYPSKISLFKVFINSFKLIGEMPIDWVFFLGVRHLVNSLSVSVTDCPGIALIFWLYLLRHLESDHLFTFNFATIFHQYFTIFTFPPLKNITKHLFIM